MDEARLKALYRRHSARATPLDDGAVDDICHMLQGVGGLDERETALDRVADSALQADIARVAAGLDQDIAALSREIDAVRQPQRRPILQRLVGSGLALAASVAAIALTLSLFQGAQTPHVPAGREITNIAALSFEDDSSLAASPVIETAETVIFGGDFDS